MRSSKQRSRSKSNRPKSLGNVVNRVFDSSGPEGKVRGTPQQIIDKYLVLARDAQLSGDRVALENFMQHAEHYTRMLSEAQRETAREQEARRDQGQPQNGHNRRAEGRDGGQDGGDRQGREYADTGQGGRDGGADRRQDGRDDRNRDDRGRDDRNRDDRGRDRPNRREDAALAPVDQGEDSESMLIETPESRARTDQDGPAIGSVSTPEAEPRDHADSDPKPAPEAEKGDAKPKQPRARATTRRAPRKPKPTESGPDGGGSSSAAAAE